MSDRRFALSLTAVAVTLAPAFALFWVIVVATVNFHDVLAITAVAAVLWHLRHERRRDTATARELRRQAAERRLEETVRFYDTGPVWTPREAPAWEPDAQAWAA